MRSVSYAVVPVANAIKTSIATVAAPVTYTGVQINGAIGPATMNPARLISVTSSASGGSYTATAITITGTNASGAAQTDTLTLTATGGNETIVSTKAFATVTSIAILAMTNTSGAFTFGVRDVLCPRPPNRVRVGTTGNLKVGYPDGTTDTIVSILAGETLFIRPSRIYADSATTATNVTLIFDDK